MDAFPCERQTHRPGEHVDIDRATSVFVLPAGEEADGGAH